MYGHFIAVGVGGAVGAMLRHAVGMATLRAFGPNFPWGTLTVNIVGGFLMGLLVAMLAARGGDQTLRLLLGVGVLGGFTTFSAFSLDVVNMIGRGAHLTALGYIFASVAASVGALYLGRAVI